MDSRDAQRLLYTRGYRLHDAMKDLSHEVPVVISRWVLRQKGTLDFVNLAHCENSNRLLAAWNGNGIDKNIGWLCTAHVLSNALLA